MGSKAAPPPGDNSPPKPKKLPATVIGLGLVSFLTDISSEAIFPLLPIFLSTLGASHAFIGLVEGAANFIANVLKYFTGVISDRRTRLKPLVLLGYGISTVVRPLVAFALAPWHVLFVRACDRVGKGVRTAPRDALIADATTPSIRARAYGFHRAMDHAGAAVGTLLSIGLLWLLGATTAEDATVEQLRTVFLWAAIPGVLAMLALILTKEPARQLPPPSETKAPSALPAPLKRALLPITLFAFANATDVFILVKAMTLGASPMVLPLLWLVIHLMKASTATVGGRLADLYGKRNILALGWAVYAVTWSMIGFAQTLPLLWVFAVIYGMSNGLVEGAEKALVAELASGHAKGKAFGAYHMLIGFAALLASTSFGLVWDKLGGAVAFVASGIVALVSAVVLLLRVPARQA